MIEKSAPSRNEWLLLAGAVLCLFAGLSATPLIDLDEGAFTAATLEMFARGDFLLTYLNGEPRYDKPILIYWLQALSVSVLGFDEFALRLPSAFMGLVWVGLAFHFADKLFDRRTAIFAAIITATAAGPSFIARIATADALLDACIAAAVFFQYLWLRLDQPRYRLLGWAAMGFGFLAKGPVALVLPLCTLLLHCASRRQWRQALNYVSDGKAILLFLTIALPWYVAVTWVKGPEFLEAFFFKHNVGRFSGAMGNHHAYGYFYYLPIALLVSLPFTGILFSLPVRLRSLWHDDFARYALILFALVFLLFSLSANKLPHYLLYGTSALWVLLARQMLIARSRWQLLPALLLFVALLFLPDLLEAARLKSNRHYQLLLADLATWFGMPYRLALGGAIAVAIFSLINRSYSLTHKLALCGILTSLVFSLAVLPALGGTLQSGVRQAGQIARDIEAPLVMYGLNIPSLSVYASRVVLRRKPQTGDLVLLPVDKLDDLPPRQLIFKDKSLALVRITD